MALPPFALLKMKIRFPKGVALVVSTILHTAALVMILAPPEIGKNTPVLAYPVRERVMEVNLAPTNAGSTVTQPKLTPQLSSAMAPPATVAEGRLEKNEKLHIEYSARYFTTDELTERPTVLSPPDLGATDISPTIEGEAVLHFFLNENGSVDRIEVQESTLPLAMMEQLQAQRDELRFTPGSKNGVNVKSMIRYKISLARDPGITTIYTSDGFEK